MYLVDPFPPIFPFPVGSGVSDGRGPVPPLTEDEQAGIARAIPSRVAEFAHGRECARRALVGIGVEPTSIPRLSNRAPAWPEGVVGSITHCEGFVGAVVVSSSHALGIGIDAEPDEDLDEEVLRLVFTDEERAAWDAGELGPEVTPRAVFSAKECVHKSIFPSTDVTLDFREISLKFDGSLFTVTAESNRALDTGVLGLLRGEFTRSDGLIFSACYLTGA